MSTNIKANIKNIKIHKIKNNQFIKFLTFLINKSKLFHISTSIRVNNKKYSLKLTKIQADQRSKINIIFINLVKKHRLELVPLKKKFY